MSDKNTPNREEPLSFDQMELHSDINVHGDKPKKDTPKEPPAHREAQDPGATAKSSGSKGGMAFLFVLFLAAGAAAGWLWMERERLQGELAGLQTDVKNLAAQAAATSEDLQATKSNLEQTKTSLDSNQGSLADAQSNLSKLKSDLTQARKAKAELDAKVADLESDLKAQKSAVASREKTISQLRKDVDREKGRTQAAQKERDSAKKTIADLEAKVKSVEEDAVARIADAASTVTNLENDFKTKERRYKNQVSDLEQERDRLKRQMADEAKASRKILNDMASLNRQVEDLGSENRRMKSQLADAKDKVSRLENVNVGDLVPFSESLEPARLTYREPLPEGVKIPRKPGVVFVNALINEVGAVESAFLLADQDLEAAVASAVVRTVYKWKFAPASLEGVRVKTWQPLMVKDP